MKASAGGSAPAAERQPVEHRAVRVGEVRGVAGQHDVVDERRRGGELVAGQHVSGAGVEHARVTGGAAGDEQSATGVDLRPSDGVPVAAPIVVPRPVARSTRWISPVAREPK
ncbi:hypothetical protein NKG94_08385 [Micromonospora sp. M12]